METALQPCRIGSVVTKKDRKSSPNWGGALLAHPRLTQVWCPVQGLKIAKNRAVSRMERVLLVRLVVKIKETVL